MKLPRNCRILKVCGEYNPHPYLDMEFKGHPKLVATNGRIMVVIPVKVSEFDQGGYVDYRAINLAASTEYRNDRKYSEINVDCGPTHKVNSLYGADKVSSDLPRPEGSLRDWRKSFSGTDKNQREIKFGLNAAYLRDLADALGSSALELTIRVEIAGPHAGQVRSGITVTPIGTDTPEPNAVGIIMPITL